MSLFLFEIPVFVLIAGKGNNKFLISLVLFLGIVCLAYIIAKQKQISPVPVPEYPLADIIFSLILAARFCIRWNHSGRMKTLAELIHYPTEKTCIILALLLAFLAISGIDHLLQITLHSFFPTRKPNHYKCEDKYIIVFLCLTAFAVMFLNSRCSPLYPFNDWVDPNTMFTVGKGVLKGKVPYRDLYDVKGPLMEFLHTFGAAISYDTFIGIWFPELAACLGFLYFTYKSLALYFGKRSFPAIPLIAGILYSSYAFRTGDSAEEFALPMLAYAFYTGCRALKANELPSPKTFLLIGISSGAVFWMKYSMTGFYLGWYLTIFILALFQKKTDRLIKRSFLILGGITIITIPILLFFAIRSGLSAMFEAYFFNNIFYYSQFTSILYRMKIGMRECRENYYIPLTIMSIGGLWLIIRKQIKLFFYTLLTFSGTFFFIFIGGTHNYYCLLLGVFCFTGGYALLDLIDLAATALNSGKRTNWTAYFPLSFFPGLIILCCLSYNLGYLKYEKEELFQYKMKEIIEQSGISEPTVLYYRILDAGVNTTAGLLPNLRYFCFYNIERLTDIMDSQYECIKDKCVDYIISLSKYQDVHPEFETYDYRGWIIGTTDKTLQFYHWFTPKE